MLTTKELSALLEQVLHNSPDGIIIYQTLRNTNGQAVDFAIVEFNEIGRQMSGLAPDQLYRGQQLLAVYPQAETLFDSFVRVAETGRSFSTEHRYEITQHWFSITATQLGDGLMVIMRDISEARRVEQALKQQAERLRATLDASINGIMSFTAIRDETDQIVDLLIDTVNQAAEGIVGHKADALVGQRLLAIFPGNVESGFLAAYARAIDTGEPQRMSQYYNDGTIEAWFEVSAVRMGTDGVVVTFADVTQNQLHQQQLENSNRDLEQFAYVASHDLQEPLRKIQSLSDLLASRHAAQLSPQGVDLFHRIQLAAHRMQALIIDLLAYSRLTNLPANAESVSLDQVVREVLVDLETIIQEREATITVGTLPVIWGDASQLRQLLQNLLTNALKFQKKTLNGTFIKPDVRIISRRATVSEKPKGIKGTFAVVEVADNGIGFDPQYRDRIFQLFQRLHSRDTYAGTGIGLAICQKVAENHGGLIMADSEPGQGATFRVVLPVIV